MDWFMYLNNEKGILWSSCSPGRLGASGPHRTLEGDTTSSPFPPRGETDPPAASPPQTTACVIPTWSGGEGWPMGGSGAVGLGVHWETPFLLASHWPIFYDPGAS